LAFLGVPSLVGETVVAVITLESFHENAFTPDDVRLLSTLAASLGVALENARLFAETRRLLSETEQRAAELAVINSVQQGLVAQLEFQGIIDLVGDKLREVIKAGDISIRLIDEDTQLVHFVYNYEHGERREYASLPLSETSLTRHIVETRQPLRLDRDLEQVLSGFGKRTRMPGSDMALSVMAVPVIARDRVIAVIDVENFEREAAFSDADVRLLSTLAASMGVALENARLFAETRRLLSETEQRAAELAVINSVQHGLAAKLDFQAVIDLVRTAALGSRVLIGAGVRVTPANGNGPGKSDLWVTEPTTKALGEALRWRKRHQARSVVLLGAPTERARKQWAAVGSIVIDFPEDFEAIRHGLGEALGGNGASR
jgi:GAF domain-containing protein